MLRPHKVLVALVLIAVQFVPLAATIHELPKKLNHFAFGSCAKERLPQPIWEQVIAQNPQLFLFLGDNMYADTWKADGKNLSSQPVTDPARIVEAYNVLAAKPGFARLRSTTPMLGIWDDHDYGANDAGKEYPLKEASQQHFLDFFGFSANDPVRQQQGIYHSRITGSEGQRVQFIMLDTRYHRDPLNDNPQGRPWGKGPYLPVTAPESTILGEAQWLWLEQELKKQADIRFIASSIQVVAYQHAWESWGNFPEQRQKLYNLIAETKAEGVIFLSGDRHLTEASVDQGQLGAVVPYPMWDLTSSGMTDEVVPVDEINSFRRGAVYRGTTFATVSIEWAENNQDTQVVFRALDENSALINEQRIRLDALKLK